jgi:outer membrane protein OmpA-like peptidoglycan-associated protein
MRRFLTVFMAGAFLIGTFGCASLNKKEKGAIIGGASGAVLGGVIGKQAGNTAVGAIVGAAVGGTAGAIIGDYMDDQAEELQADLKNAKVERVGEGIKITFDSGILFDVNKANLRPNAQANLTQMAGVLNKYPDTNILIEGHTDSSGSEEYNQTLSERRAGSVAAYLAEQAVASGRMTTVGYGESQPIADNSTEAGKQANRRVEVAIIANEKLKKAAMEQAGKG